MLTKYRGVILGLAYADALGAGYEFFKGKIGEDEVIDFIEIPKINFKNLRVIANKPSN